MRKRCSRLGLGVDRRPFCIHGPMLKRGRQKSGAQQWGCRAAIRRELADYHDRNALRRLMYMQNRYHRERLEQLQHQIEGVV